MKLIVFWRPSFHTGREQTIDVAGVDLDPSGSFWYYVSDPNDRVEVPRHSFFWARVIS